MVRKAVELGSAGKSWLSPDGGLVASLCALLGVSAAAAPKGSRLANCPVALVLLGLGLLMAAAFGDQVTPPPRTPRFPEVYCW